MKPDGLLNMTKQNGNSPREHKSTSVSLVRVPFMRVINSRYSKKSDVQGDVSPRIFSHLQETSEDGPFFFLTASQETLYILYFTDGSICYHQAGVF